MLSLGAAIAGLQYLIGRGRKIGVWGSLRPGYVFALCTLSISSVYGQLGAGMSIVVLASVVSLIIDDLICEKAAKTT